MTHQEQEFKRIYHENYSKIMRLCMGYVSGNRDAAKDLAQEVFIKVWNNLGSFRKESTISTWTYRIAVNTCLMKLRNKKNRPLNISVPTNIMDDAESAQEKEKQFQEMYRCIDTLSPTNKAIILMELEALPQKEIAQVMGVNHEAIRTRIHRIKNQLSKCVNYE